MFDDFVRALEANLKYTHKERQQMREDLGALVKWGSIDGEEALEWVEHDEWDKIYDLIAYFSTQP